jgi:hypothetical protein
MTGPDHADYHHLEAAIFCFHQVSLRNNAAIEGKEES